MGQANLAQREPSMEEILASIRRIIEDGDNGRQPEDGELDVAKLRSEAANSAAPKPFAVMPESRMDAAPRELPAMAAAAAKRASSDGSPDRAARRHRGLRYRALGGRDHVVLARDRGTGTGRNARAAGLCRSRARQGAQPGNCAGRSIRPIWTTASRAGMPSFRTRPAGRSLPPSTNSPPLSRCRGRRASTRWPRTCCGRAPGLAGQQPADAGREARSRGNRARGAQRPLTPRQSRFQATSSIPFPETSPWHFVMLTMVSVTQPGTAPLLQLTRSGRSGLHRGPQSDWPEIHHARQNLRRESG